MANDKRTGNVSLATPAIQQKAEADFQKAKAEAQIQKAVAKIVKHYTAYRTAARKALPEAAEAGRELTECKKTCKDNGIIWQQWCDKQREKDDNFPVRFWCDKLIQLAAGWDKVKDEPGITSVESAVLFIKGKATDQGQTIKHKGTGKRKTKVKRSILEATIQAHNISLDQFQHILIQIGLNVEVVD